MPATSARILEFEGKSGSRAASSMKLGFVTGRMGCIEGNALWTDAGLGRLIDALAARAGTLTVALSLAGQRRDSHDHRTVVHPRDVAKLPHMPSTIASLPHGAACRRALQLVEARSDVVVVQLPFAPPWSLVPQQKPRVYHACADVPEVVGASAYYRGLKRIAAVGFAEFMHTWTRALVRDPDSRLVANGQALQRRLGDEKGRAVVSSTLSAAEVDSVRRRRPANAPFRILFVGYLRPEKGLDVLIGAYRQILASNPTAELVIVGARDLSEAGAESELRSAVESLGTQGKISFLGQLGFGKELFQAYADADVVAVPSRSEGTPRVLVEARAFRCPVVASNVGGIPTSVTDQVDGLLVPPGDPHALAAALLQIVSDPVLRSRLVTGGLDRARRSTVDAFADVLFEEARALCA